MKTLNLLERNCNFHLHFFKSIYKRFIIDVVKLNITIGDTKQEIEPAEKVIMEELKQ